MTTLYSAVHATLLESLAFEYGDALLVLWIANPAEGEDRYLVSPQDFGDWRDLNEAFQGVAAACQQDEGLAGLAY